MRIPKLSDCCEIEILGMPHSNHYGGPSVGLRITAHLNGETYAAMHELRPELLDDDGYGESIIRHVEHDIGRMVVRGKVPVDPRGRVMVMQDHPPSFDRRVRARAGG